MAQFRNSVLIKNLSKNTDLNNTNNGKLEFPGRRNLRYSIKDENIDFDGENDRECCGCNSKLCWYEPKQNSLPFEFFRDSSLHGLKYIGQPHRHISERIFWILAFLIGVVFSVILISQIYDKYYSSPVIVAFQDTEATIFQVPFPAVTICNVNNVRRSKAEEYEYESKRSENRTYEIYIELTKHICTTATQSFSQKLGYQAENSFLENVYKEKHSTIHDQQERKNVNETSSRVVEEFLRDAGHSCETMIIGCTWRGKIVNCTDLFTTVETDFGLCCTFNMVPQSMLEIFVNYTKDDNSSESQKWKEEHLDMESLLLSPEKVKHTNYNSSGIKRPRRTRNNGKFFGLSVLLDPEMDEYFCTAADSTGFHMVTHLPTEVPHILGQGISIPPGMEVSLSLTPDVTTVAPELKAIPLEKRNCYFTGEASLKFYAFYTFNNCFDECMSNMTKKACHCTRYYMPRDNDTELCQNDTSYGCTTEVSRTYAKTGQMECEFACLPTCTEIAYYGQISQAPLRTDVNIWTNKTHEENFSNRSVSILHVYFEEDSTHPKQRKQLYTVTDLIANTGGLLGLCLGFSVLSLLELIYYFTLRAWFKFRYKKRAIIKLQKKCISIWEKFRGQISRDSSVLPSPTTRVNVGKQHPSIYNHDIEPYFTRSKSRQIYRN